MSQRPYPGLRAFWRNEIDIFFGRERQIDEILEKLQSSHFLAVLGPSGCGKSSLVRTGVLSALDSGFMCKAGAHWLVADMKPGSSPFLALAKALLNDALFSEHYQQWFPENNNDSWKDDAQYFLQASLQRGPQSFHELLDDLSLPEGSAILLLVDQFEEIFRYRRYASNEAGEFVSLILTACQHPSVYTAITMRSEFLGNCVAFQGLPEAINQGLYLTPSLDRDQLSEAIEFPARVFGGEITPELTNRLLNDAGQAMDQLPLLQHALMRLWENDSDKEITLDEYEQTGGLQRMLNDHLEEVWKELDDEQKRLAGQLFRLLTEKTPEGHSVRRPVTFIDALSLPGASRKKLKLMIGKFQKTGRHFLMPPSSVELQDNTVIDITHESLIRQWSRLNHWVDTEAEHGQLYQRLESSALRYQQGEAALLSSPELEIALHWRDTEKPTAQWAQRYGENFDVVMDFLEKSLQAKQAEALKQQAQLRAKNRRTLLTTLLGFVIAVGAAVFGWLAAEKNADYAREAQELAEVSVQEAKQAKALAVQTEEKYVQTKEALDSESIVQQKLERENEDLRYISEAVEVQTRTIESYGSSLASVEAGVESLYDRTLYESLINQARLYMEDERYPEARKTLLDAEIWRDKASPALDYQLKLMQRKLEISGLSPSLRYDKVNVPLYSVAIDPQRNALLSVGENGWVFINEQGEKKPEYRVQAMGKDGRGQPVVTATIQDIAVDPSGNGFATADDAGQVIIWNWPEAERTETPETSSPAALKPEIYISQTLQDLKRAKAIAYSQDGQYLAVGYVGKPAIVSLWKIEPGYLSLMWVGSEHSGQISEGGLSFAPNGMLASASHDGSVRFWETSSAGPKADSQLQPLRHPKPVLGMSFSSDGRYLATAAGKQVFVWDWLKGRLLHSFFTEHSGSIFSLQWVKDQFGIERLVTAGQDKTMRMWKVNALEKYQVLLAVFNGHQAEVGVSRLAYDSNRRQLYSPGKEGSLLQWRTNLPWTELIPTNEDISEKTALNADGSVLGIGLNNGLVQLYKTGVYLRMIDVKVGNGPVSGLLFSPTEKQFAALTKEPNTGNKLSIWSFSDTGGITELVSIEEPDTFISDFVFSQDGKRLYTVGVDGKVGLIALADVAKGIQYSHVLHRQKVGDSEAGKAQPLVSVSLSSDGQYLLVSTERQISNWKLQDDGLLPQEAVSHIETDYVLHGAKVSPDYQYVIAVGRGGILNRYPLDGYQIIKERMLRLESRTQTVVDAQFIPEANAMLTIGRTVGDSVELQAFDMSTNQSLFTLKTPSYNGTGATHSWTGLSFSHQCTEKGCRIAVPLKAKGNEKRQVAVYDFSLRSPDE